MSTEKEPFVLCTLPIAGGRNNFRFI